MMNLEKFSDTMLKGAKKSLEDAKAKRSGGLMICEQKALDHLNEELERRADIAYCKAHDC